MEIELYGFYERYLFSDVVKSKTKSVLYLPCFALACSGLFCFGFAFCFVFLVIMCTIFRTDQLVPVSIGHQFGVSKEFPVLLKMMVGLTLRPLH